MESFITWWQHLPSKMDPVIFTIGGFPIRWYATMYLVAFAITYLLAKYRIRNEKLDFDTEFLSSMITWCILGLLLGARVGYVLFYNFEWFLKEPLSIILPFSRSGGSWHFTGFQGMSYHGGVIGVTLALLLFSRKQKRSIFKLSDLIIPGIPLGFTFGRLGNFINNELYGRITEASIGMHFPSAPGTALRHPSQLYEAFFEGIVLFLILWPLRKLKIFTGFITGLYIFGYGFFRFFIEFFREPDEHLGFVLFNLSMGQLLCIAMMLSAFVIWYLSRKVAETD
jgi:phosphatidylglycerol:prolipoprotein diacylglycerol transferase